MAVFSNNALLGRHPNPIVSGRSFNADDKLTAVQYEELQDSLTRAESRVLTDNPAALLTTDGTSGSTIALYRIDIAAGNPLVSGVVAIMATAADTVILGAGTWDKSYTLAGGTPAALSADGKTYDIAVVAIVVSGAVQLHAVFGAEADDTSEVAPTTQQIKDALIAASITGLQQRGGLVVARVKIQRVATDTITMTHTTSASNAGLLLERSCGNIFGVES
jgi:glycerate kinase